MRVNLSDDNAKPSLPEGRAWEFESKSSPGMKHYVTIVDGNINCTCMGWKGHRKCWHTTKVLTDLADPKEIEEGT